MQAAGCSLCDSSVDPPTCRWANPIVDRRTEAFEGDPGDQGAGRLVVESDLKKHAGKQGAPAERTAIQAGGVAGGSIGGKEPGDR